MSSTTRAESSRFASLGPSTKPRDETAQFLSSTPAKSTRFTLFYTPHDDFSGGAPARSAGESRDESRNDDAADDWRRGDLQGRVQLSFEREYDEIVSRSSRGTGTGRSKASSRGTGRASRDESGRTPVASNTTGKSKLLGTSGVSVGSKGSKKSKSSRVLASVSSKGSRNSTSSRGLASVGSKGSGRSKSSRVLYDDSSNAVIVVEEKEKEEGDEEGDKGEEEGDEGDNGSREDKLPMDRPGSRMSVNDRPSNDRPSSRASCHSFASAPAVLPNPSFNKFPPTGVTSRGGSKSNKSERASPVGRRTSGRSVFSGSSLFSGTGGYTVFSGTDYSIFSGMTSANSADSYDSYGTTGTATTVGTTLSMISLSNLPCVHESKVGGPKYYVATMNRRGEARIVHAAMPGLEDAGGIGATSLDEGEEEEERGFEVLEYRLVRGVEVQPDKAHSADDEEDTLEECTRTSWATEGVTRTPTGGSHTSDISADASGITESPERHEQAKEEGGWGCSLLGWMDGCCSEEDDANFFFGEEGSRSMYYSCGETRTSKSVYSRGTRASSAGTGATRGLGGAAGFGSAKSRTLSFPGIFVM